jgi:predicted ester cyclase
MSVEENKAILRRLMEEVWNEGNLDIVPDLISPEFSMSAPSGPPIRGPEGFRQSVAYWRSILPDLHFATDEVVGEEDRLAARFTTTGTFEGRYEEYEPTGRQIKYAEAAFLSFKGGKLLEQSVFVDWLDFFRQMGIKPQAQ